MTEKKINAKSIVVDNSYKTDRELESAMYDKLEALQNILKRVSELHKPIYVTSADLTVFKAVCEECNTYLDEILVVSEYPTYPCKTIQLIWGENK